VRISTSDETPETVVGILNQDGCPGPIAILMKKKGNKFYFLWFFDKNKSILQQKISIGQKIERNLHNWVEYKVTSEPYIGVYSLLLGQTVGLGLLINIFLAPRCKLLWRSKQSNSFLIRLAINMHFMAGLPKHLNYL
jgi:hypothetical protein